MRSRSNSSNIRAVALTNTPTFTMPAGRTATISRAVSNATNRRLAEKKFNPTASAPRGGDGERVAGSRDAANLDLEHGRQNSDLKYFKSTAVWVRHCSVLMSWKLPRPSYSLWSEYVPSKPIFWSVSTNSVELTDVFFKLLERFGERPHQAVDGFLLLPEVPLRLGKDLFEAPLRGSETARCCC